MSDNSRSMQAPGAQAENGPTSSLLELPARRASAPMSLRGQWREFRVRFLPALWFLSALLVVAALWPSTEQVSKSFRSTSAYRDQMAARPGTEQHQFASHPTVITNSEGQFSFIRVQ